MRNTRDPPDAYIMSPRYDRIIRHVRCHDKVATPLPLDSSIQTKHQQHFRKSQSRLAVNCKPRGSCWIVILMPYLLNTSKVASEMNLVRIIRKKKKKQTRVVVLIKAQTCNSVGLQIAVIFLILYLKKISVIISLLK